MEEIISKEDAKKWMELEGKIKGMGLQGHGEFILKEKGKEGLKIVEDKLAELGYPIKFEKLKPLELYPFGLEIIMLLAMKQLFNFDDEKIKETGVVASTLPIVIRLYVRYFISLKSMAKRAPTIWRTYYTIGDLSVIELDEKKKYAILRVENVQLHPLQCLHLHGYFANFVKLIVNSPAFCEETKCTNRGDEYHEFLLKW